ncbi:MAG: zinc ribbon domain-containing protein [Anaerolineales bacterium]|nr:zinc ribbon domain-containing protein [Anaerolineales bacterium]
MPLYEYYCADCRTKFEALRPMNKADSAIQCKSCESMRTSRVLSLFATHTKAEGSSTIAPSFSGNRGGGCCGGHCGCGH